MVKKMKCKNNKMVGNMMRKYSLVILSSAMLQACAMIPSLDNLTFNAPKTYPQGQGYNPAFTTEEENSLTQVQWQNFFNDPVLIDLVEQGLEFNQDLKIATLNIEEARALYGIQRSELLPDVNVAGGYTKQQTSGNTVSGAFQSDNIFETYNISAGISGYELDFFGRIRSLNEAALNDFLATQFAKDTVRVALISDIASTYASLLANQSLNRLALDRYATRQESYDLIKLRVDEGIGNDLELSQAETLLLQAKIDRFQFLNALERDKNALRLLVGKSIVLDDVEAQNTIDGLNTLINPVPVGLPSTLLASRPDILSAEYQLYSRNADIGAARAAFFPRISLTAAGGYSSLELGDLFDAASQTWSFAPQISLPIFTGGRLKNNLDLAQVRKNIAIQNYEKAIQVAFRDVSDALTGLSNYKQSVDAQSELVEASQKRNDLTQLRYDSGIDNYLAVLDAKREAYAAEQNLIREKLQEILSKIALYKAVGGGKDITE